MEQGLATADKYGWTATTVAPWAVMRKLRIWCWSGVAGQAIFFEDRMVTAPAQGDIQLLERAVTTVTYELCASPKVAQRWCDAALCAGKG